ncbi:hypothetical protein P692DRAFT_20881299 [Suillus brevipes Sb2]|nr:hypothetical protein P692DRAFT_20881299 [Suillus brevipes Sb2]
MYTERPLNFPPTSTIRAPSPNSLLAKFDCVSSLSTCTRGEERRTALVFVSLGIFLPLQNDKSRSSIPQVRSGLAGHYICETIHETGLLVALDLMLACGGGEYMEDLRRVLIAKHNEPPFCAGSEGCLGAKIACDILADCSRQPGDAAFYWWLIMYLYR